MPGPGDEHAARDTADNRAFRARASEAYGRDGWARGAGASSRFEDIAAKLTESMRAAEQAQAGPESAFPAELVRKAAIVGRSPLANVPVRGDPFVGDRHCRIVQVRRAGDPLDGSVWVEQVEPGRATRIRPGDGSPDTRVEDVPVRIFPGDTLIVGNTEIPWTAKE